MHGFKIFGATIALALSVPASAVVIDFETTPGGTAITENTPITTQYASLGVTFSAIYGTTAYAPIATTYAAGQPNAYYSGNFLANSTSGVPGNPRFDVTTISFTNPVNAVSFGYNSFCTQCSTTATVYNAAGTVLQTVVLLAPGGWDLRSLSAGNISRIELRPIQFANGANSFFGLDKLTYTVAAVPEPATWGMMVLGFGLAGAALRRRAADGRALAA